MSMGVMLVGHMLVYHHLENNSSNTFIDQWNFIPQMTALHYATMREASNLSVVECLVENGADVNSKDEENVSSIMLHGNIPTVTYVTLTTCIASHRY